MSLTPDDFPLGDIYQPSTQLEIVAEFGWEFHGDYDKVVVWKRLSDGELRFEADRGEVGDIPFYWVKNFNQLEKLPERWDLLFAEVYNNSDETQRRPEFLKKVADLCGIEY